MPPSQSIAGAASLAHGTLNGFGVWFSQGLLGVKADPAAPGFSQFDIRPAYDVGLGSVSGTTYSPMGDIGTSWAVADQVTSLNVTIPVNTRAAVWIPASSPDKVTEGGGPAVQAADFIRQDGDSTVWSVGSGSYTFVAH